MFYVIVRAALRAILKVGFGLRVDGQENLPGEGPVILVANHASMLDPVVLGCAVRRPVRFMAKHELFRNRVFASVLRSLGAFPVRRGQSDRQAFHTALDVLSRGEVLGIFPEGTRSLTGELQQPYSGAAVLAEKTGAPVVPVGIMGTRQVMRRGSWFPRPGRIAVRVGKPLYAAGHAGDRPRDDGCERDHGEDHADVKTAMMRDIAELLAEGRAQGPGPGAVPGGDR